MKHICIFFISCILYSAPAFSQKADTSVADTTAVNEKFGLRLGADLYRPIRSMLDDTYSGFEIMGDYRVYEDYYLAVELGNESKTSLDDNISSKGSGSYLRIGFDYNAHNNWAGLNNMIYGGLRYGTASFSQELLDYNIATNEPVYPGEFRTDGKTYNNLQAHWAEVVFGIKTEVLNNLFFSIQLQLKNRIAEKEPENFENLFIPGFGRTYEDSQFGAGFSYGISYLIPFFKK